MVMVLIEESRRHDSAGDHADLLREPIVVRLRGVTHVDRHPDWVFGELHDPGTLLSCVPGGRVTRLVGPRSFEARIAVGLGPFKFVYSGTGQITASDLRSRTASMTLAGRADTNVPSVRVGMAMRVLGHGRGSEIRMDFRIDVADPTGLVGRRWVAPLACDQIDRTIRKVKERLESTPLAPAPTAA